MRVPFTTKDEEKALRRSYSKEIAPQVYAKFTAGRNVVPGSSPWTGKCSCPFHKGGSERTPSFCFSEETGQFYCFGCAVFGDSFDLLDFLGGNGEITLMNLIGSNATDLRLKPAVDLQKIFSNEHRKFAFAMRARLTSIYKKPNYGSQFQLVQSLARRVDENYDRLLTTDQKTILAFFMQVKMDLGRIT